MATEGFRRTLLLAAGVVLVVAVAATGWLLGRTTVPDSLDAPGVVSRVALTYQEFDDARSVNLSVRLRPSPGMVAHSGGLLTESACAPGASVTSGSGTFVLDRVPLVNLSTPQPLARRLVPGDTGADVREIQDAFRALGFEGAADGVVGTRTLSFFNDLRRRLAADAPLVDAIDPGSLVWLADTTQQIDDCPLSVGTIVDPDTTLAELPPDIVALRVGTRSAVLPSAPRVLEIDGVTAAVSEDGAVDASAWSQIAATDTFTAYLADPEKIVLSAEVRLRDAVDVARVPPSALFDFDGDSSCLSDGATTYQATVVSTSLGYTLMQFAAERPDAVDIAPPSSSTCP